MKFIRQPWSTEIKNMLEDKELKPSTKNEINSIVSVYLDCDQYMDTKSKDKDKDKKNS